MIDLSQATFIIPLRIDSGDRLRNIILSTSFLLNTFDCKVIIKESDEMKKFETWALPTIKKLVPNLKNLKYVYQENHDDHFHRTKLLNDMIMMSETEIVINYDSDIILPISSYIDAYQMLMSKEFDVVYPYKFGEMGERKVVIDHKIETEEDLFKLILNPMIQSFVTYFNPEIFDNVYFYAGNMNGQGWAEYGMVQFFNRQVYIEGYLENEGFIAYAPEDVERHHRWKMLGYKIGRVNRHAYHLEHERTQNSWYTNPFMQKNNQLWEYLKNLSKEELITYYENQTYFKERMK